MNAPDFISAIAATLAILGTITLLLVLAIFIWRDK